MSVSKLCVLCCNSCEGDAGSDSELSSTRNVGIVGYHQTVKFKTFCEELRETDHELDGEDLITAMNTLGKVSICSNCFELISTTVDCKQKVEEIESRVRSLQLQVLQELKQLKLQLHQMHVDVGKIGDVIRSSEKMSLDEVLENSSAALKEQQEQQGVRRSKRIRTSYSNEVVNFREKVLAVSRNLYQFKGHLTSKTDCKTHVQNKKYQLRSDRFAEKFKKPAIPLDPITPTCEKKLDQAYQNTSEADLAISSSNSDTEEKESESESTSESDSSSEQSTSDSSGDGDTDILQLDHMSDFKKQIISRILEKRRKDEKRLRKMEMEDDELHCPFNQYSMDYNNDAESISVAGIAIEISEGEKSLACSWCSHKVFQGEHEGQHEHIEFQMHCHIIGVHFNAFECPECLYKFDTYYECREHLVQGHKSNRAACETCDKPPQPSVHKNDSRSPR